MDSLPRHVRHGNGKFSLLVFLVAALLAPRDAGAARM